MINGFLESKLKIVRIFKRLGRRLNNHSHGKVEYNDCITISTELIHLQFFRQCCSLATIFKFFESIKNRQNTRLQNYTFSGQNLPALFSKKLKVSERADSMIIPGFRFCGWVLRFLWVVDGFRCYNLKQPSLFS